MRLRTPSSRVLPSVIGGPGGSSCFGTMTRFHRLRPLLRRPFGHCKEVGGEQPKKRSRYRVRVGARGQLEIPFGPFHQVLLLTHLPPPRHEKSPGNIGGPKSAKQGKFLPIGAAVTQRRPRIRWRGCRTWRRFWLTHRRASSWLAGPWRRSV